MNRTHCSRPDASTAPAPAKCTLATVVAFVHALVALAVFLAPSAARAEDIWTEPNPGVRHLHRTTPAPAEFNALVIDLSVPGVAIRCTPVAERWKSTSEYVSENHLAAAINGGFWGLMDQRIMGLAAGNGTIWGSDDEELGFFAFTREGHAFVSRPQDVVYARGRGVTDAVSGRPLIVDHGHPSDELATFARTYTREPRSAAGVSQDGTKVILATVDGRRSTSHGGTLIEMAQLMIELGAYRAINLDGGSSTTMVVANEGGVVNRPSRGWEREVLNHIGVIAPPPPVVQAGNTAPARVVTETPQNVVQAALQARSSRASLADDDEENGNGARGWLRSHFGRFMVIDRLGLGRHRELVVPLLFGSAFLIAFATVFFVGRRLYKRAKANKAQLT